MVSGNVVSMVSHIFTSGFGALRSCSGNTSFLFIQDTISSRSLGLAAERARVKVSCIQEFNFICHCVRSAESCVEMALEYHNC